MEYASNAKGNLGVTLGAIGSGLSLLNGGIGNILGNNNQNSCPENQYINRYELGMAQQLSSKDGEIALLKSEKYTDEKMVTLYTNLEGQIGDLAKEVRANKTEQQAINMNQAVYNGTNTATLGCLQNQVAQLLSITKMVVPNSSVCPGWGDVNITPATSTTTATTPAG